MGTTSVLPRGLEAAFRLAAEAGFDGIEVMITGDPATRDAAMISALSRRFGMPVLSIHAPVLVLTAAVYGLDPRRKLERSVELAQRVGANTVVVHPPFRWQWRTARRFEDHVAHVSATTGATIAVENMFPVTLRGREREAYAPHWNPGELDVEAMTLDFSHAALAGVSALELAERWGDRLRHVHLCDGSRMEPNELVLDEHLVPGRGVQPVAEVLALLAARGWSGAIVAEINSRACRDDDALRLEWLRETVDFARQHTTVPASSESRRAS